MLVGVADQLGAAYQYAGTARAGIDEAARLLRALGEEHAQPLPPPQLRRAADELDRSLRLISSGAGMVADITARL